MSFSIGSYILSKNNSFSKLSDNEDELDLHCIQLAEKMENDNVSGKRQRKKSRMAKESDEMDFIVSTVVPSQQLHQQGEDHQHQDKQPQLEQKKQQKKRRNKSKTPDNKTNSTPVPKAQQQKSSKKEEEKKKKSAQIEAGKTQAAAFFKDRLSAASYQNGKQPFGCPSHPASTPSNPRSPPLQQKSLPKVAPAAPPTQPAPSHTVSQTFSGPTPLSVNLPSQSPSQSEVNLQNQTDSPSLSVSLLTSHNPPSYTSLPTQNPPLYNASLLPTQSSPKHTSVRMECLLPSGRNLQPPLSPISVHSPTDLTVPPSAAASLGETGYLIRSSLDDLEYSTSSSEEETLHSSSLNDDISSVGNYELLDEVEMPPEMPCQRCSRLVNELRAEIVSLRKRQLPG